MNRFRNLGEIRVPRAFVLINVESGYEEAVLKQLKNMEEVTESFVSYGVYDLIVRIKVPTMEQLKDTVSKKIRVLDHVRTTLTLIIMDE